MAHYNFIKDLTEGEAGEAVFVDVLKTRYNAKFVSDNKTNSHDVILQFSEEGPFGIDTVSFEVKTDVYHRDTGNMFVEFECRGKPSGIKVSRAEWFVTNFKHLKEIWCIRTHELKTLIETNTFYQTQNSGDAGSRTRGYLVPRKVFQDKFFVIRDES
jgi:hypothetical protein